MTVREIRQKIYVVKEERIHPTPISPLASLPLIYDNQENISPLWYRKKGEGEGHVKQIFRRNLVSEKTHKLHSPFIFYTQINPPNNPLRMRLDHLLRHSTKQKKTTMSFFSPTHAHAPSSAPRRRRRRPRARARRRCRRPPNITCTGCDVFSIPNWRGGPFSIQSPIALWRHQNGMWGGWVFSIQSAKVTPLTTVVHRVVPGPVPTYKIREWDDTPVDGTFYDADLQKVHMSDVFRIKKVLKRQKDRLLVKWKGWPDKYNSWIARGDVTSLRPPKTKKEARPPKNNKETRRRRD